MIQSSEAEDDQLTQVSELEIENIFLYFSSFYEDLLVLVLVSNQELGTGGPEEYSQAKISQVENIIHTWDHISVQCCKIASYC
jgi:hypothetical protein